MPLKIQKKFSTLYIESELKIIFYVTLNLIKEKYYVSKSSFHIPFKIIVGESKHISTLTEIDRSSRIDWANLIKKCVQFWKQNVVVGLFYCAVALKIVINDLVRCVVHFLIPRRQLSRESYSSATIVIKNLQYWLLSITPPSQKKKAEVHLVNSK